MSSDAPPLNGLPTARSEARNKLDRLLKAQELASETGIPLQSVYALAREGTIPTVRMGRAVRFAESAVREWIATGGTVSMEATR